MHVVWIFKQRARLMEKNMALSSSFLFCLYFLCLLIHLLRAPRRTPYFHYLLWPMYACSLFFFLFHCLYITSGAHQNHGHWVLLFLFCFQQSSRTSLAYIFSKALFHLMVVPVCHMLPPSLLLINVPHLSIISRLLFCCCKKYK